MFEETSVTNWHADKVFGRFRMVVFTFNSDGTNLTLVSADSTAGVTGSGVAAAVNITYPTGTDIFLFAPVASGTTTVTGRYSAVSVNAGTGTLVLSAAPSAGGQLFVNLLVARSG